MWIFAVVRNNMIADLFTSEIAGDASDQFRKWLVADPNINDIEEVRESLEKGYCLFKDGRAYVTEMNTGR